MDLTWPYKFPRFRAGQNCVNQLDKTMITKQLVGDKTVLTKRLVRDDYVYETAIVRDEKHVETTFIT